MLVGMRGTSTRLTRRLGPPWAILAAIGVALVALIGLVAAAYGFGAATAASAGSSGSVGSAPSPDSTGGGPADQSSPVAAFLGDSYTAGEGADGPGDSFTALAARDLGWVYEPFAIGGTGYVQPSPDLTYGSRVDAVIAAHPDVVVIAGTRNDLGADPAEVRSAAADVFSRLRAGLPQAEIVVVGPIWTSRSVPADVSALDAAVGDAARAAELPYISALSDPWLDGSPELIAPDGIHPTQLGHEVLSRRLVEALQKDGLVPAS